MFWWASMLPIGSYCNRARINRRINRVNRAFLLFAPARVIIEGRGDGGLTCTAHTSAGGFADVRGQSGSIVHSCIPVFAPARVSIRVSWGQSSCVYLYDGGGERIAKFPTDLGATRREFARVIIEGRGDGGADVPGAHERGGLWTCRATRIRTTGNMSTRWAWWGSRGCGGGNYCPNDPTTRQQAAVFFLKGEAIHCPLGTVGCTWTPPACTPPPNQRFADVPCPSQYADWIEELADEGITAGCGSGNFCPTQVLGSWQMLAWAQKIWPGYCPLPRTSVLTYRDEGARVITEANQLTSGDDTSETDHVPEGQRVPGEPARLLGGVVGVDAELSVLRGRPSGLDAAGDGHGRDGAWRPTSTGRTGMTGRGRARRTRG